MNYRRENFRDAARARFDSARLFAKDESPRQQVACYLAHIALECALKLRILVKQGAGSVDDFERKAGTDLANRLFRGAQGHDLRQLREAANMAVLLGARDRARIERSPAWLAMLDADRPYSLRYCAEKPSKKAAEEQVELVGEVVGLILEENGP